MLLVGGWGVERSGPNREIISFRSCVAGGTRREIIVHWVVLSNGRFLLRLLLRARWLAWGVVVGACFSVERSMIASFRSSCLQHSFLRVAVRDRPAVNDRLHLFLGRAVNDRQHSFSSYRQYLLRTS